MQRNTFTVGAGSKLDESGRQLWPNHLLLRMNRQYALELIGDLADSLLYDASEEDICLPFLGELSEHGQTGQAT